MVNHYEVHATLSDIELDIEHQLQEIMLYHYPYYSFLWNYH